LGHADGNGQAMAERSGIGFHARYLIAVRMAVEARMRLEEGADLLFRNEASLCKRHIERQRYVPLGKAETVAIRPLWCVGRDTREAERERSQEVDSRHVPTDMAGASFKDRLQIAKADLASDTVEIVRLHELLAMSKYTLVHIFARMADKSSGNAV